MLFSRAFVKKSKFQVKLLWSQDVFILTHVLPCSMTPSEGIRIEEMGVKFGCNGVDNAKLWFNHV
jgi:hypothetical protein